MLCTHSSSLGTAMAMLISPFLPSSSYHRQPIFVHSFYCRRYDSLRLHSSHYQPLRLLQCKILDYRNSERSLKVASQNWGAHAVRGNMDEHVSTNCRSSPVLTKPSDVVRELYASINAKKLEDVRDLVAENCVYEDFVYPKPFVGRQAVLAFFKKFMDSLSHDLQFVIDDISKDDSAVVAVAWHIVWRGRSFPFSKGCSFYRCDVFDGKIQIVYGRDSVEPAVKPGDFALVAVRAVTALLERFPWLAERL